MAEDHKSIPQLVISPELDQLKLFYQLSMNIGVTLEPKENCQTFCKSLLSLKRFDYVSVWKKEMTGYSLYYSGPEGIKSPAKISDDHFFVKHLGHRSYTLLNYPESFSKNTHTKGDVSFSQVGIFKMTGFGILVFADQGQNGSFNSYNLEALSGIISKFSLSMITCFSHEQLKAEINRRRKTEVNLIKAERQAVSASRAKSEFLANMSHEIRTPLNAIIGFGNLLAECPSEEDAKTYIHHIQVAGKSLLDLINDVLDFSKIESGRYELHKSEFSPKQSIEKVLEVLKAQSQANNVKLIFHNLTNSDPRIMNDENAFMQIVTNLGSNAVKFTKNGTVEFALQFRRKRNSTKGLMRLTVKDQGIGIPQDHLEKIFEKFQQVDNGSKRQYGGTGLGLAITKRLTTLMNGKIRVSSQIGAGSSFVVKIPVQVTADCKKNVTEKTNLKSNQSLLSQVRILVAEDNAMNRIITADLLKKQGAQIEVVEDGLQVIEILKHQRFDLILMDCQMPNMDGYETSLRIRKSGLTIPIIALTAHAFNQDREKCLQMGMNDHITKPIDPATFIFKIAKWIHPKKASNSAA